MTRKFRVRQCPICRNYHFRGNTHFCDSVADNYASGFEYIEVKLLGISKMKCSAFDPVATYEKDRENMR